MGTQPLPVNEVDVPCSLFLGLNTELSPTDLPEGVSPDNADVIYLPGSVSSRPGLHKIFLVGQPNGGVTANSDIVYCKSLTLPTGNVVTLILDSLGFFFKEDTTNNPGVLVRIGIVPKSLASSVTAFGREYIAFHDGVHGTSAPLQFDGTFLDRVSQSGPGVGPTAIDSGVAGLIVAGVHKVVVMFLTRQGYLTAPSPISANSTWTAGGGKKVTLTNIPIGPPNVVARVFAFTGAGGNNFFIIPQNITTPTVVAATVIFDNTTTTADLDFSDNTLFGADPIDVAGNNQFNMRVLDSAIGVFYYSSRTWWWGSRNEIPNLLNMGFEGGTSIGPAGNQYADGTIPLGWSYGGAGNGGILLNNFLLGGSADFGLSWQITGDGTGNNRGQVSQSFYQDSFGVPIAQSSKNYTFRVWMQSDSSNVPGVLVARIQSVSTGFVTDAQIVIGTLPVGTNVGIFMQANFNLPMPAVIPSDMTLYVYASGQSANQAIIIDEMSIIDTSQPFLDSEFVVSYPNNPEAFDGLSGRLGSADDPSAIKSAFEIRSTLYFLTANRLHETSDSAISEPAGWTVRQVADNCGGISPRCVTSGEEWVMWASPTGLRIFDGGFPYKISQEIQTKWDSINLAAQQFVWTKNDPVARRCYVGVPLGAATAPNKILVLDYRESDTGQEIASRAPIHISFTGKMIASDLGRKWTVWNISNNCGEVLQRPGNSPQFFIGSGTGNNPFVAGLAGFANIYYLDPAKLTDDDYGQISPFYTTYFFVNHDMEMGLGIGSHRKLCVYLAAAISGVGMTNITPFAASLTNPYPNLVSYQLPADSTHDLEWGVNVTSERIAFKLFPSPLAQQTDVKFALGKLIVTLKKDPVASIRGAV